MAYAKIHHFTKENTTHCDETGVLLLGFYFELIGEDDTPLSGITGPLRSKAEAEAASISAWENDNYQSPRPSSVRVS